MILYRHPLVSTGTPSAPPWLDGAPSVVRGETLTHRLAGIGDDYEMGDRPGAAWADVDDGWQAVRLLPDRPILLHRRLSWARSRLVADAEGRQWQVPVLLTPGGHPAIIATIGDDWLPAYTEQQRRLLQVAQAAAATLETRHAVPIDLPVACQWAAEALAAANHLTVRVIQRTGCLDAHLAVNVLIALTGALDAAELAAPEAAHG